jgi:hypothetical protein
MKKVLDRTRGPVPIAELEIRKKDFVHLYSYA